MKKIVTYIFIILVVIQSGTIVLYGLSLGYFLPIIFIISAYYNRALKHSNKRVFYFLIATAVLLIYHYFEFELAFKSQLIQIISYFSILLIVNFNREKYLNYLMQIILFFSATSLLIWSLLLTSDVFFGFLVKFANSLPKFSESINFYKTHNDNVESISAWIYHINFKDGLRNNSIFYEPGRFVIFLIIGLMINLFELNKSLLHKNSLLLIATIISTFSTTGYSALMILLFIKAFNINVNFILKLVLILIFVAITAYILQLDFMLSKIQTDAQSDSEASRFVAILYHFEYIKLKPLLGYGNSISLDFLSPNGVSLFILKYGFVYFILFSGALFYFVSSLIVSLNSNLLTKLVFFVVLFILAFSQTVMDEPIYISLAFYGLIDEKKQTTYSL